MKPYLILLLVLMVIVLPAAARVTVTVGETYVRWSWPEVYANDTVIRVDGQDVGTADGRNYYYLTDLRANEEHQLALINTTSGTVTDSVRVTTLYPLEAVYFGLAVLFILAILCMAMQDLLRIGIAAGFSTVLAFFLFDIAQGHGPIWIVVVGLVGVQAIFLIKAFYDQYGENLNWW